MSLEQDSPYIPIGYIESLGVDGSMSVRQVDSDLTRVIKRNACCAMCNPFRKDDVVLFTLTSDQRDLFINFSAPSPDEIKLFIMLYPEQARDIIILFKMEGYREKQAEIEREKQQRAQELSEIIELMRQGWK